MVFTQGRGYVIGVSFGLQNRSLRCRVLVCHAADTASLAAWILFGKLFGVATLVGFGEKRCRKNLPLRCSLRYLTRGRPEINVLWLEIRPDNNVLIRSGEARLVGWSRSVLYSGLDILPRSVTRSANSIGRSDNLDVIHLRSRTRLNHATLQQMWNSDWKRRYKL